MDYKKMLENVLLSSSYERLKRELYEETKKHISICENDLKERKAVKESLKKQLAHLEEEQEVLRLQSANLNENIEKMNDDITQLQQENSKLLYTNKRLMNEKKSEKDELKKKFQAYCTALAYYKKNLQCYIDIEKDVEDIVIFSFHFFASEKKDVTNNYFVRFEYSSGKWKVIDLKPEVSCTNKLYKHLNKTSDVLGFLSHIRNLFLIKRKQEETSKQK